MMFLRIVILQEERKYDTIFPTIYNKISGWKVAFVIKYIFYDVRRSEW